MARSKGVSQTSQRSEERVYDSSDENESAAERLALRPVSKKGSNKESSSKQSRAKALNPDSTSDSGSETGSESSGEESTEPEPTEQDDTGKNGNQNDSDSELSTSSGSSKRKMPSKTVPQSPRKKTKTTAASAIKIAPKPFQAPPEYEPVVLKASDYASKASSLFEDLSGKQIWHISAPDSVSIESIEELDIQAALRGESILTQNGLHYNMHAIPPSNDVFLLPQGTDLSYGQKDIKISRSFHLREMGSTPKSTEREEPLVFTATQEGKNRIPRKQPEGLKMRYMPYGATPAPHENDVEMTTEADTDTFQVPDDVVDERSPGKAANEGADVMRIDEKITGKNKEKDKTIGSTEKKKKKKRRIVDEDVE